ncbi:MAG: hypothetical protein EOP09_15160 [Proteobacteria bacterium]|nr:MAG: hypothetical protein EOP09_15160 [Pseudomonadota bacterium]
MNNETTKQATGNHNFSRSLRDILVDVGNETIESDGQTLTRFELMMRRHGKNVSLGRATNNR